MRSEVIVILKALDNKKQSVSTMEEKTLEVLAGLKDLKPFIDELKTEIQSTKDAHDDRVPFLDIYLAVILLKHNNIEEAKGVLADAINGFRILGWNLNEALGEWLFSIIHFENRDYERAQRACESALALMKSLVSYSEELSSYNEANEYKKYLKQVEKFYDEISSSPIAPSIIEYEEVNSSSVVPSFIEKDKSPRTESDRPSGLDQLNYNRYARSFAEIILNHETSTPLTIGIYGQWGQGKSFLMGKIKEALNDFKKRTEPFSFWKKYNLKSIVKNLSPQETRNRRRKRRETVDFHIVEFNAWAYVGTDHLWAGLVTHLYTEIEKYFGLRVTIARLGRVISRSLPKSLPIFILYGLLGFGVSLLLNFTETQRGWEDVIFGFKAFIGTVIGGAALAGLPVLLNTSKEFIENVFLTRSKNLQNLAAKPDFKAQIGIMADIKEEIRFMGKLLRKGRRGHPTRFILFVDDLDRCEHKKAVEVMQAIMLLLADEDGAPFVIFMGIDARVIVHAIEETYGDILVKAGINGYEYLEKIVQIPFVIPGASLVDIKRYVDSMLWTEEERDLIARKKTPTSLPEQLVEDDLPKQPEIPSSSILLEEISVSFTEIERMAINQCTEDLIDNPRKIKRIINIYRFARLILPPEQDRTKAIQWFLMTEQWPLHVAWILEHIENDIQTKNKLKSKKLSDVYKLAKKNIHSKEMESLLAIDADPDKFAGFVEKNDFTVQEILTLLPITFNLNPAIRSEVNQQMRKIKQIKPRKNSLRVG